MKEPLLAVQKQAVRKLLRYIFWFFVLDHLRGNFVAIVFNYCGKQGRVGVFLGLHLED